MREAIEDFEERSISGEEEKGLVRPLRVGDMRCVEFLDDELLNAILGGGVNHVVAWTGAFWLTCGTFEKADFLENWPNKTLV